MPRDLFGSIGLLKLQLFQRLLVRLFAAFPYLGALVAIGLAKLQRLGFKLRREFPQPAAKAEMRRFKACGPVAVIDISSGKRRALRKSHSNSTRSKTKFSPCRRQAYRPKALAIK